MQQQTMFIKRLGVAFVLLMAMGGLVACASAETPPESPDADTAPATAISAPDGEGSADQGYPPPTAVPVEVNDGSYPVDPQSVLPEPTPLPENYPASAVEQFLEPRFQFDLPIEPSAAVITGQAPPGLAIAIVDVTFNGGVLGSGVVDQNGRFEIGVSGLNPGNRIGITFAELEPGLDLSAMSEKYFPYRGDNFANLPNVGIFFETTLVNE